MQFLGIAIIINIITSMWFTTFTCIYIYIIILKLIEYGCFKDITILSDLLCEISTFYPVQDDYIILDIYIYIYTYVLDAPCRNIDQHARQE